MDQTHLHLLITHLPIFGSLLGVFVLVFGMWRKSDTTILASYFLFIISTIGAVIAYVTGEAAEETVENIQGVSESVIEQHADFAQFALIGLIVLGVAALASALTLYKKSPFSKMLTMVTLFLSIVSFVLVARTGYLGGQIRHTEIAAGVTQNAGEQGGEQEGDDD
ncbi:DUF2231 domain-containing protein [Flavobacterium sp. RSB2_4_14]|uniref:DUF2231 domain-containing protein n=1 Tax=Flavobacterium sp. RSB2_4_14 TaxID=3447665 RepID=UPI003F389FB4